MRMRKKVTWTLMSIPATRAMRKAHAMSKLLARPRTRCTADGEIIGRRRASGPSGNRRSRRRFLPLAPRVNAATMSAAVYGELEADMDERLDRAAAEVAQSEVNRRRALQWTRIAGGALLLPGCADSGAAGKEWEVSHGGRGGAGGPP